MATRHSINRERGAIAVIVAIVVVPVVLGFLSLAIDVGYAFVVRNQMQNAADSAALAGANNMFKGGDANSAQSISYAASTANGFTTGTNNVTVTASTPPASGTFAGKGGFMQVSISHVVNPFFAKFIGVANLPISVAAVAGPSGNKPCILTLAKTGNSLNFNGNGSIDAVNCGIYVNSNSGSGLSVTGNATVTGNPIDVVGNSYSKVGNGSIGTVTTGVAPEADPFASMTRPSSTCTNPNPYSKFGNGTLTLNPGTYCGGISLTGNFAVTLNPGLYVIYGGGISLAGNISMSGSGVSIYNTGNGSTYPYGALHLTGNAALDLSAPTSGDYAGMLFFQDPSNTQAAYITGNAGSNFAGNMYFPNNVLTFTGNSSSNIPVGSIVASTVTFTGNDSLSVTNAYGSSNTSQSTITLVQ